MLYPAFTSGAPIYLGETLVSAKVTTGWQSTAVAESVNEGEPLALLYGGVLSTQALCNGGGLPSVGTILYRKGRPFIESLALWAAQQWVEYFRFPFSVGNCIPLFASTLKNKRCALHLTVVCGFWKYGCLQKDPKQQKMSIRKQPSNWMCLFRWAGGGPRGQWGWKNLGLG